MEFSVEMYITEAGKISESRGYLRDSKIELNELLQWTKSRLIILSDIALREEQAKGFDKDPLLLVDGRPNKSVQKVSPLGQIEFVARSNIRDVLSDAYKAILYRSKVLTGTYKSSHFVFLNGQQVATDLASLEAWLASYSKFKQTDLIRIVNIQPYARKLERYGITAQGARESRSKKRGARTSGVLVPNGTYALTARAIRSKYKANSVISFQFVSGGSLGIAGSFRGGRSSRGKSASRPYLYPSLVISVQERG